MIRTSIVGLIVFVSSLIILPIGVRAASEHDHLTEVACVDVPPGEKRPEFGCFNVATVKDLKFSQTAVYWHLYTFGNRKAAEAVRSATGIVVEEDGRVWLSEFGARDTIAREGEAVAVVGPLQLPEAKSYSAVLSYAVMHRATVRECTHIRVLRVGMCSRESSAWRLRQVRVGQARERP